MLSDGRDVAAAAVEGLPAIFFLAISSSLSRQVSMRTAVEWVSPKALCAVKR